MKREFSLVPVQVIWYLMVLVGLTDFFLLIQSEIPLFNYIDLAFYTFTMGWLKLNLTKGHPLSKYAKFLNP